MAIERTLAIIKPDAVRAGHVGDIISMIEGGGFRILSMKMDRLSKWEAELFYREHSDKVFFRPLVDFMTSGDVVLLEIEGDDAVAVWRQMMGSTDSSKASADTIRGLFGNPIVIRENAVHGSDSVDSASRELALFFQA